MLGEGNGKRIVIFLGLIKYVSIAHIFLGAFQDKPVDNADVESSHGT